MTLKEFNTFLEEGTTNEIFESFVLYHIQDNYMITGCNTNSQGDKIYTIQDLCVGRENIKNVKNKQLNVMWGFKNGK